MPGRLILLMVSAPLAVVASLLIGRSVWLVFAVYHVGICLLVPASIDLGRRRWPLRRHLRHLGLSGPGTARGLGLGALLAAIAGLAVHGALSAWSDLLPDGEAVLEVLARWGLRPGDAPGLVLFMAVVNGPAEELFWRGFVAAELGPASRRAVRLLVPALFYAGYHAVTIPSFVHVPWLAALMFAAVAGAGVGWAWLRERTGSVWPALLSHGAAAVAYMFHARILPPL